MKISCVRKLWFCAGHRVLSHEGKCANCHGHNYTLYAYAEADDKELDSIGRVIDFSVIKGQLGTWIDKFWDHTFLIFEKDEELFNIRKTLAENKPAFICSFNPTAENMAKYLLDFVCPVLFNETGITITKIKLYETENCYVEVEKE